MSMAKILSGKDVSQKIKNELKIRISELRNTNPNFLPHLAIVQVGNREDSNVYIKQKLRSADECGMKAEHIKLDSSTTELELTTLIDKLNANPDVHGIIVQLPLDTINDIDSNMITNRIVDYKDVDGLSENNAGKLAHGQLDSCIVPCTPRGCLELILNTGIELKGKHCVVIGRSKIVGRPMADILLWNHGTVTVCHSRTKNIAEEVNRADVLVVAIGQPLFVKGNWVKEGAIVIDCGINSIEDSTKQSGKRLVGDVEFEEAKLRAHWITPVPGGVGPMTVAMLLKNTVDSAIKMLEFNKNKCEDITPDIRFDEKNHWIKRREKQRRCQNLSCQKKPLTYCEKCDATLCVECFAPYHEK